MTTLYRKDQVRSTMTARATTEQSMSGHIGHPAAWMMDNKKGTPEKVA
jgi:hypothetical protein